MFILFHDRVRSARLGWRVDTGNGSDSWKRLTVPHYRVRYVQRCSLCLRRPVTLALAGRTQTGTWRNPMGVLQKCSELFTWPSFPDLSSNSSLYKFLESLGSQLSSRSLANFHHCSWEAQRDSRYQQARLEDECQGSSSFQTHPSDS